jgi:hypothetical protein
MAYKSTCIAQFKGYFSPTRKCISIDGEGETEIKITADATELAGVITALAQCKAKLMSIRFYKTKDNNNYARPRKRQRQAEVIK